MGPELRPIRKVICELGLATPLFPPESRASNLILQLS